MWPGSANSYEILDVLASRKSDFQQIDVYQTRHHGRMLVLDGIVQLTEFDEFAYQEMMAHLPLFAHPDPETVLVIGGGDGGVLREVGRHQGIKQIDFCEIDKAVVDISRQFFPGLACGFDDPRVVMHFEDASRFIRQHREAWDVIIVDSSDPVGPAVALFEAPFYNDLKAALRPGGIIASQAEAIFLHQAVIRKLVATVRSVFPVQAYANIMVPTYPGGHIGVCLGSLGPDPEKPNRQVPGSFKAALNYYCESVHRAAFVLPLFASRMMEELSDG